MTNNPYFQNVVSNFLALAILIVLGLLVYYSGSRRPRLSFFGIQRTKKLVVYLSHLRVRSGGAIGVDGSPRSFGESAIPDYEAPRYQVTTTPLCSGLGIPSGRHSTLPA